MGQTTSQAGLNPEIYQSAAVPEEGVSRAGALNEEARNEENLARQYSGFDPTPVTGITPSQTDWEMNQEDEPQEIESRIKETRAQMGHTLDALQQRLKPEHIKEQVMDQVHQQVHAATSSVKEATLGKAGEIMHNATETVSEVAAPVVDAVKGAVHSLTDNASHAGQAAAPVVEAVKDAAHSLSDHARSAGSAAADGARHVGDPIQQGASALTGLIQKNPLAAGVAAFGIGWLLLSNNSQASHAASASRARLHEGGEAVGGALNHARESAGHVAEEAQDKMAHAAEHAREAAAHVGEKLSHHTGKSLNSLEKVMEDTPLALGALALAVGAGVALLFPSTAPEQQLLGETGEKIKDRAQSLVQDTAQKVSHVAEHAFQEAARAANNAVREGWEASSGNPDEARATS